MEITDQMESLILHDEAPLCNIFQNAKSHYFLTRQIKTFNFILYNVEPNTIKLNNLFFFIFHAKCILF